MTRRRLLGDDLWARHLEPPTDEREIARHFTLTRDELLVIASKRTGAARFGFALLLLYLRYPGRVLEAGEVPPEAVLAYVARQLGVATQALDGYAARDATRREHLAELMAAGGYAVFSRALAREMVGFLAASAQTIVRPGQLAGIPSRSCAGGACCCRRPSSSKPSSAAPGNAPRRSRTACSPTAWTMPRSRGSTVCWPHVRPESSPGSGGSGMHRSRRR
jgi:hypothetical protein